MGCCSLNTNISFLKKEDGTTIDNIDIDDFYSRKLTIDDINSFSIQLIKKDADGTPKVTIECSNDNREDIEDVDRQWVNYSVSTTNVNIGAAATDDSIILSDTKFPMVYFRIKIEKNDCTTGTITAILALK